MNEENDRIAIGYDEIVVPLARSQTVSTLSKNEEKGTNFKTRNKPVFNSNLFIIHKIKIKKMKCKN